MAFSEWPLVRMTSQKGFHCYIILSSRLHWSMTVMQWDAVVAKQISNTILRYRTCVCDSKGMVNLYLASHSMPLQYHCRRIFCMEKVGKWFSVGSHPRWFCLKVWCSSNLSVDCVNGMSYPVSAAWQSSLASLWFVKVPQLKAGT